MNILLAFSERYFRETRVFQINIERLKNIFLERFRLDVFKFARVFFLIWLWLPPEVNGGN